MAQQIIKKRFIAGAVCPRCAEMDKLRMFHNEQGEEVRECVACDFSETYSQHKEKTQKAEELTTRVTPVGKATYDEGEQPLKIMELNPMDQEPPTDTKH